MLRVSSHSERPMRLVYRIALVIGVMIGSVALPSQIVANAESRRIPRWCASMGGDFGFDCSYDTFAQCMETARGLGNYCLQNPRLPAGNPPVRQQRRVRD